MANVDTPFGLRPVRHLGGAPYSGGTNVYSGLATDATAMFVGDPVKLSGTSQTIRGRVYLDVDQAATGDVIVGVVVSVVPDTRDSLVHRAASTQRLLNVCDDPDILFEIQEVSGGTALTANDAGLNADFVVGTGNATTGQSGVELNNTGEATTATLDLHIYGLAPRDDVEIGEHAKWLVRINRHQHANQVAGI